jgi:hypothetical protein
MNNTNIEHDNYEGNLVATSGPSNDGLLTLTFEVAEMKHISIEMSALDFLRWFDKDTIDGMKESLKKYIDRL